MKQKAAITFEVEGTMTQKPGGKGRNNMLKVTIIIGFVFALLAISISAQTTEFTYQGILKLGTPPNTSPATGMYDFEFRLFAVDTGGSALGTLQRNGVDVQNGAFSVKLDFGDQFPGTNRYLEINVRPTGGGGFQQLLPRQQISSSPYSVKSKNADTAGNVTGVVAIANGGTGSPTKNFVDLSTDQTGIGGNKTFSGNLAVIGNVGIGTNPTQKLSVSGTGGVRANVNSDLNAGLGLSLNNAPGWSVATVTPGQFQIFNDAIGQNAVWIDPANNNVGIGSSTPAAKLEVNGYTKLGSDAPAIRVKKITGTTSAFEGSEMSIPTGLDAEKILSISVMVRASDPTIWLDANSPLNGSRYYWYFFAGDVRVVTVAGGSAQILSKPVRILITYEP